MILNRLMFCDISPLPVSGESTSSQTCTHLGSTCDDCSWHVEGSPHTATVHALQPILTLCVNIARRKHNPEVQDPRAQPLYFISSVKCSKHADAVKIKPTQLVLE